MASTARLVRSVRDGREAGEVRGLMSERRRLLGELVLQERGPENASLLVALAQAVSESDRTLEDLLGVPGN